MRIKHNAAIAAIANNAADELGLKPSRAGWAVRAEQLKRLERLLEAEERPTTHKPKRGKQALRGRVRVERVRCVEVEVEGVDMLDDRTEIPLGHWYSYDCSCSQCARMRAETVV